MTAAIDLLATANGTGGKTHPGRSKKTAEKSITEAEASSLRSDHAIAGYKNIIAKMGHIIGKYDSHRRHLAERHDVARALQDLKESHGS